MANELVTRETLVVGLERLHETFEQPEKLRLQLDKRVLSKPFDLGALAYAKRDNKVNTTKGDSAVKVILSSFRKERRQFILNLTETIITMRWRESTVKVKLGMVRKVLSWADSNNHAQLFVSERKFRDAYQAYTDYLFATILEKELTPRSAREYQSHFELVAKIYFGENEALPIVSGISIIKTRRTEVDAPEKDNVKQFISTLISIARGYGAATLEQKPYPWLLQMGDYKTFVFPSNRGPIRTPYTKKAVASYNYDEGRISTIGEYHTATKGKGKKYDLNRSNRTLKAERHTKFSKYRMENAFQSMQAYMNLFILMTGINPSELVQLEFDSNLDIEKCLLKNSFKAVKFRAGGRVVKYNLGSRFGLIILKEYLKIREFILDGNTNKHLFFTKPAHGDRRDFQQLNPDRLTKLLNRMKGRFLPETFKNITPRVVRKHKSVVLHELKVGTRVIADTLNHKMSTNEADYVPSSPDRMKAEFGTYWASVEKAAKDVKLVEPDEASNDASISIPTGHCKSKGNPISIRQDVPVEPNCQTQYGCLYCEHFQCHADDKDVRKLVSVKYVVEQVINFSGERTEAEKLLLELVGRIKYILDRISSLSGLSENLVTKVSVDVYDYGELTPFWEHRIRRYQEMGVIL